jgi:hypothetical protein
MMRDVDQLFAALSKSSFRQRFRLGRIETLYLSQHGLELVLKQGRSFIDQRLAPAHIPNDGKQTPFRNHPIFVAQHATATCCRGCLQKWHGITKGHTLKQCEIDHVMGVLSRWLQMQNVQEDPKLF